MEETALKFVHGVHVWAVAIHKELGTGRVGCPGAVGDHTRLTIRGRRLIA